MKKAIYARAIGIALFISAFRQAGSPSEKTLQVVVSGIQNTTGKNLYVGLYCKQDDFPAFGKYWVNKVAEVKANAVAVTFDVPFGDYAIAVFHDLNGNKTLDKNFVGYPKEPFGFSKNFKPKLSNPDFEDCQVSFEKEQQTVSINLIE